MMIIGTSQHGGNPTPAPPPEHLWTRGVVLVATSNRHPDKLYENGLQRQLFLPFIAALKSACHVHDLASPVDYRRLAKNEVRAARPALSCAFQPTLRLITSAAGTPDCAHCSEGRISPARRRPPTSKPASRSCCLVRECPKPRRWLPMPLRSRWRVGDCR